MKPVILLGLESSGKTSLAQRLQGLDDVSVNVRGSTKSYKQYATNHYVIVDTPGFRIGDDIAVHDILPKHIAQAEEIWLVARGPHLYEEMQTLYKIIERYQLKHKLFRIFITFKDKMTEQQLRQTVYDERLPIELVDLRHETPTLSNQVMTYKEMQLIQFPKSDSKPQQIPYFIRVMIAMLAVMMMFVVPVWLAYQLSSVMEGWYDAYVLSRINMQLSSVVQQLLFGHYGLLSIGIFSIIWAFPVVILLTIATEIYNEIGIKDWITDTLDPLMRHIGLTGSDLLPVITGFGCNVVAINETKSCFSCTKQQCVSIIAFGSACSYQIGATLSVLSKNHHMHLIMPYVFILIVGTVFHAKLFKNNNKVPRLTPRKVYLKMPSIRGVIVRSLPSLKMFITQALPIFFLICIIASVMEVTGLIMQLNHWVSPLLGLIGLGSDYTPAVVASMIRKDGILLLNSIPHESLQGDITILIALLICSTLTPCFVTMIKIGQTLGIKNALIILAKQATTIIILVCVLLGVKWLV